MIKNHKDFALFLNRISYQVSRNLITNQEFTLKYQELKKKFFKKRTIKLPKIDKSNPTSRTINALWLDAIPISTYRRQDFDNKLAGKWCLFYKECEIYELWLKICSCVQKGELGYCKVSTWMSLMKDDKDYVICVYCDSHDYLKVRDVLRKLGITKKIPFKTNQASIEGLYSRKGGVNISKHFI